MSDPGAVSHGLDFVPWKIPDFDVDGDHRPPHTGSPLQRSDAIRKEAYAEGFELGRREGVESARQETASQVSQFIDVLESLSRYSREFDQQIARDLVALSGKIAEQIILRELSIDHGLMLTIVEKIIDSFTGQEPSVVIYLHPNDATNFEDHLAGTEHKHWKIIEDQQLNRGDCRLESNDSVIDSKLHELIDTIVTTAIASDAHDTNAP